jgi:hypothetical protein
LTNKSTDEETAAALPIPDFEFLHQEKRITGQEKAKSRTQACFYRIHITSTTKGQSTTDLIEQITGILFAFSVVEV